MKAKIILIAATIVVFVFKCFSQLPLFFEENFESNTNNWAVWNNAGSGMWQLWRL